MDKEEQKDPFYGEKDPLRLFNLWYQAALEKEPQDAGSLILSTAAPDKMPSARVVLLKKHDEEGFVFYTNKLSRKGQELAENPQASLLFYWRSLKRQVEIRGKVVSVTDAEADAYFKTRPRGSAIGAWASLQSQPLAERAEFTARIAKFEQEFAGRDVPRPPHWSGYRVIPSCFEFWEDREFRLHTRSAFTKTESGWQQTLLYP